MKTTERQFKTIVANPGWELVEFMGGDGLVYTPIIGWDIEFKWNESDEWEERAQTVSPITVVPERARYWMVKRPDGKFQNLNGDIYEYEAEALKCLREAFDNHPPVKTVG